MTLNVSVLRSSPRFAVFALPSPFLIGGSSCSRPRSFAALSLFILLALSVPCAAQYPGGGYPGGGYPGGGYPGGGSSYVAHGTYVWSDSTGKSPTYSGDGHCVTDHGSGPGAPVPYGPRSTSAWTGRTNGWGGQTGDGSLPTVGANCSGAITPAFTWKPDPSNPNEPPPALAIVQQDCMVQCYLSGTGSTGSYDTGFGQSGSGSGPYDIVYTRYSKRFTAQSNPGPSFSLSPGCSPSVSASAPPSGGCGGLVEYSATATVPLLQAHSTVDTANWDPAHPRFFSGTNCSVSGTAVAYNAPPGDGSYPNGGIYVKQATLTIGGTVVKEYDDTNTPPSSPTPNVIYLSGMNQSSVPLSAFFDSTHFGDSTSISIQMTVTDSGGLTYTVPISANAYNKPYPLGNYQPTGGQLLYGQTAAQNASAQFNAMNYAATSPTTTDGKGAILNKLPTYTAFYIWTHGLDLTSESGDCFAHDVSPDANYLFANASDDTTGAQSVTQAVNSKILVQPAYNFVFLDACLTSQNDLMAGAFGITTSSTDLAYLGYTTESDDNQHNTDWSNRVMVDLAGGSTIADAVTDANNVIGYPTLDGQHAATYIWGDKGTKVHGVFGGPGTQWFR